MDKTISQRPVGQCFALLLSVIVVCFLLGACGDSDEPAGPDTEATAKEGQTTVEPEGPKTATPDEKPESEVAPHPLGEPRDDLDRIIGMYGDTDNPGRDFFVAPASRADGAGKPIPEGYLMIGAAWGDVAPWYMKSVSQDRFEQQWVNPHAEPLVVEFEFSPDGRATALKFLSVFDGRGRLQRLGDLAEK